MCAIITCSLIKSEKKIKLRFDISDKHKRPNNEKCCRYYWSYVTHLFNINLGRNERIEFLDRFESIIMNSYPEDSVSKYARLKNYMQ